MLTVQQILDADDIKQERVDVPEWAAPGQPPAEAFVFVRTMNALERDSFDELTYILEDDKSVKTRWRQMRARMLAFTVCDDQGTLLFDESHIEALSRKSSKPVDRLFAVAQRLNSFGKDDVESALKNS